MNGFEFSQKALAETNNKLDEIIALVAGEEVDWLEFKEGIPKDKKDPIIDKPKYNHGDYIFHVSKALLAMANSIGGMVVLGINDSGEPKPLESSGFTGDKDTFVRKQIKRICYCT